MKNVVLKGISEELGMSDANWEETQSNRDYNACLFSYESVSGLQEDRLPRYVKLETVLALILFPHRLLKFAITMETIWKVGGYVKPHFDTIHPRNM